MIDWLVQTTAAHPAFAKGVVPNGVLEGVLGAEERVRYETLRVDKRRREWLLGRWTAKELVRRVLARETGAQIPHDALSVCPKENGAPVIEWQSETGARRLPISISHAGNAALCAVWWSGAPVPCENQAGENRPALYSGHMLPHALGADIEEIAARDDRLVRDYFTEAEIAQVRQAEARDLVVNLVWSGKEAALKAIERGLLEDTRVVSCAFGPLPRDMGAWQSYTLEWDMSRPDLTSMRLRGWWRELDGRVLTLAAAILDSGSENL